MKNNLYRLCILCLLLYLAMIFVNTNKADYANCCSDSRPKIEQMHSVNYAEILDITEKIIKLVQKSENKCFFSLIKRCNIYKHNTVIAQNIIHTDIKFRPQSARMSLDDENSSEKNIVTNNLIFERMDKNERTGILQGKNY